jgi:protein-tyrosine phosphatase
MTSDKLNFPDLLNVRDLGGQPTCDGGRTRWKSLLRADELNRLTPAGVQALMDYGVRTVIDMRFPHETQERPYRAALDASRLICIHICLCGGGEWKTFYQKGGCKEMWNCAVIEDSKVQICAVMRAIADASGGGVLFHCVSGKDRTGLIAALLLALADVEPKAIERDYTITTENLRGPYLNFLSHKKPEAVLEQIRCPAAQIHNMLAHLEERYAGIAGYLKEIGLTPDEIERIRGRLRGSATGHCGST